MMLFLATAIEAQDDPPSDVDQQFYLKQADIALREGRLTQARQMISWLDQNGDDISGDDVALLKAEYAIAKADVKAAAAAIASVEQPTRNLCRFETAKGWVAANSAAIDEAIVAFGAALQHCPRDAGIWNLLGLSFMRKGEAAAGKEAFSRALMLAPNEPDILNNHAVALLQNGQMSLASEQLEIAVRLAPDNQLILANLDFVWGMNGLVPIRRSQDSDAEWSTRLVNIAKGAQSASRTPQANALFSLALLTMDHFDETVWAELNLSKDKQP